MFKVLLASLFIIQALNAELNSSEQKMDELYYNALRLGDPNHLYDENPDHLLAGCTDFIKAGKGIVDEYKAQTKGLLQKVVNEVFVAEDIKNICQKGKDGEIANLMKAILAINKHVNELKTLQDSLGTAMTEATDGKSSWPVLMCQIKLYGKKLEEIFKNDDDFARGVAKFLIQMLSTNIVQVIEKEKGKPGESCELPAASSNPSKYKSIFLTLFKAIENLDK